MKRMGKIYVSLEHTLLFCGFVTHTECVGVRHAKIYQKMYGLDRFKGTQWASEAECSCACVSLCDCRNAA